MINLERGSRIYPYIEEEAFVKIIPAPAKLYSKSEDSATGEPIFSPIVCLALTNCGRIVFCDTDDGGYIDEIGTNRIVKYNEKTEEFENWSK